MRRAYVTKILTGQSLSTNFRISVLKQESGRDRLYSYNPPAMWAIGHDQNSSANSPTTNIYVGHHTHHHHSGSNATLLRFLTTFTLQRVGEGL